MAIGALAERSGSAPSALRYYESLGLIRSHRSAGGQRRFHREALRRVAFVTSARDAGFPLDEIAELMRDLPHDRAPTKAHWTRLARAVRGRLDEEIERLTLFRDRLSGCIGCGCLTLRACAVYNQDDRAANLGGGARYLLGDSPGGPRRTRAGS